VSDFEDEVLADLGRYKETEEAVAVKAMSNELKKVYYPIVPLLFEHDSTFAEFLQSELQRAIRP